MKFSIKVLFLSFLLSNIAYAQTASILPPAKTTFFDQNGKPLTSGSVQFYIPSTTTPKTTWKDAAETIPNTNPVILDGAGRALILGSGSYRQIVKDRNNNLIWDQVTSSTGSGGGSAPTATGDGDLVGTIKPWAGLTAPNQYMFTYGQEVSRTTDAALYAAITSSQTVFCSSGSPILTGLSDTTNFPVGANVELACVPSGQSTIVSKTSNSITIATNSNVNQNTTAIIFPWGNGNGVNTFNLPDFRGFVIAGNNNMGGVASSVLTTTYFGSFNPNSIGAAGGNQSGVLLTSNLPPYTPAGTITNGAITSTIAAFLAGGGSGGAVGSGATGLTSQAPSITSTQATSTFAGTPAAGQNSTPFSLIQPTKTSNYIIKVTPDANSATASGVTDINSMTGSISCGSGLLCTGNTISVVNITASSITAGTTIVNGGPGILQNTSSGGVLIDSMVLPNAAASATLPLTGTVNRPLTSKLSDMISVLDFGADITGATDSTTAFQNAVNALPSGGILLVPGSNYSIAGNVVINHPMTLLCSNFINASFGTINATGSGNNVFSINSNYVTIRDCYINRAGSPVGDAIDLGQDYKTVSNATISNSSTSLISTTANFTSVDIGKQVFVLNGGPSGTSPLLTTIASVTNTTTAVMANAATCGGSCPASASATINWGVWYTEITLDNVKMVNHAIGVNVGAAGHVHLHDLYINATRPLNIFNHIGQGFGASDVSSSTLLSSNSDYNVMYQSGSDWRFINNKFLGGIYNFYMNWNQSQEGNLIISNNSLENYQTASIFITETFEYDRIVITDNSFAGAVGQAISIDNGATTAFENVIIANNTIRNPTYTGVGISIGKCDWCLIKGNIIDFGGTGTGVALLSASTNTKAIDNHMNVATQITNAGTNNSIVWGIANGGTNNSSPYTAGSIIFSNGTSLTQNNSNIYWDNSNQRLCVNIGSTGCSFGMSVLGVAQWGGTAAGAGIRYAYGSTVNSGTNIQGINYNNNTFNSIALSGTGNDDLVIATNGNASSRLNFTAGGTLTANGNFITATGIPTIASGACGTGTNGTITGDNQSGVITIGAVTTTSCAVSFSKTLSNAPNSCVAFPANATAAGATILAHIDTISATGFTLSGAVLASTKFNFQCY